jgi:hypothetical protein
MTIIPESPTERRRRLREQDSSTLHQHGQSAADEISQGRFAATGAPTVIGSEPTVRYPELPSDPWSGTDPVPDEPPLGYRIDAMPELGQDPTGLPLFPPVATDGSASDAPSKDETSASMFELDAGPSVSPSNKQSEHGNG